jgi:hypothetical protein
MLQPELKWSSCVRHGLRAGHNLYPRPNKQDEKATSTMKTITTIPEQLGRKDPVKNNFWYRVSKFTCSEVIMCIKVQWISDQNQIIWRDNTHDNFSALTSCNQRSASGGQRFTWLEQDSVISFTCKASSRSQILPLNFTMQKGDFPLHQNAGKCM